MMEDDEAMRESNATKNKCETVSIEEAISRLRKTEENINTRLKLLHTKIQRELHSAKVNKEKNDRKHSLVALRRKKLYEQQTSKLYKTLENVRQLTDKLEEFHTGSEVLQALKMSRDILQKQKESAPSLGELSTDLQDVLSKVLIGGTPSSDDEEELQKELEELEAQDTDDAVSSLPAPPSFYPPAKSPGEATISHPASHTKDHSVTTTKTAVPAYMPKLGS